MTCVCPVKISTICQITACLAGVLGRVIEMPFVCIGPTTPFPGKRISALISKDPLFRRVPNLCSHCFAKSSIGRHAVKLETWSPPPAIFHQPFDPLVFSSSWRLDTLCKASSCSRYWRSLWAANRCRDLQLTKFASNAIPELGKKESRNFRDTRLQFMQWAAPTEDVNLACDKPWCALQSTRSTGNEGGQLALGSVCLSVRPP